MHHEPPADLTDLALAKLEQIVDALDGDELDPFSVDAIASYARAHADEQQALRLLNECPNPFILATDGKLSVNPLRSIVRSNPTSSICTNPSSRGRRAQPCSGARSRRSARSTRQGKRARRRTRPFASSRSARRAGSQSGSR